jgi:nucleoside-diphosphate-sugar epimerase
MRVLVTGAAGLIGSGVAARLVPDHDVIGLDLNPGQYVQIVKDCLDVAEWRQQVGRVDAVVHAAALHAPHVGRRSDDDFRRANVEATDRLLDFALSAGAKQLVFTSTTSLYGHALEPKDQAAWIDEQVEPQPRDIYDETKLEAERLVATACGSLTCTSLRMSRCFPEPAELMTIYRLHRGIDRRDAAEAHVLALDREGPSATYVISAATPFEREDAAELLCDAPAVIELRCPGLIARMADKGWQPPRSIGRVYDSALATRDLGFRRRFGIDACLAGDWDPAPSSKR